MCKKPGQVSLFLNFKLSMLEMPMSDLDPPKKENENCWGQKIGKY